MSDSSKNREQLSAYLDGELSAAETRRVEEALSADPEAARELEELRAVRKLLRSVPRATAPEGLTEGILREAERASLVGSPTVPQDKRPRRWLRYGGIAAILVIAASAAVVIVSELNTPDPFAETVAFEEAAEEISREAYEAAGESATSPAATAAPQAPAVALAPPEPPAEELLEEAPVVRVPGAELAMADNVVIYTRDLETTRRSVEELLAGNAVRPAPMTGLSLATQPSDRPENVYVAARTDEKQVQWIVYASDERIEQIQNQLRPVQVQEAALARKGASREATARPEGAAERLRCEPVDPLPPPAAPERQRVVTRSGAVDPRDGDRDDAAARAEAQAVEEWTALSRRARVVDRAAGSGGGRPVMRKPAPPEPPHHPETKKAVAEAETDQAEDPNAASPPGETGTASQPASRPAPTVWFGRQLASFVQKGLETLGVTLQGVQPTSAPSPPEDEDESRPAADQPAAEDIAVESEAATQPAGRAFGIRQALRGATTARPGKAQEVRPLVITLNLVPEARDEEDDRTGREPERKPTPETAPASQPATQPDRPAVSGPSQPSQP